MKSAWYSVILLFGSLSAPVSAAQKRPKAPQVSFSELTSRKADVVLNRQSPGDSYDRSGVYPDYNMQTNALESSLREQSVFSDPTIRPGDIVSSQVGFHVYLGYRSNGRGPFTRLSAAEERRLNLRLAEPWR
jgi:hypothetical protein